MNAHKDVTVKLIGTDRNVFSVICIVSGALKKAGHSDSAKKFTNEAFSCPSCDAVLQLVMEYVNVE